MDDQKLPKPDSETPALSYEQLLETATREHPGVVDLMAIYGYYQDAEQYFLAYLEAENQPVVFTTSDGTSA